MKDIVTPVPSSELSASSVQRYEQGAAEQLEDEPSNETGDPVTALEGLYVKAGVGATEAQDPSSAGGAATKAPPGPIHRIRRKVRWNVAKIFDRGPESFLPYDGRWNQPPVPAEFAQLDLSTARALNGFRMTFRREVIISRRSRDGLRDDPPCRGLRPL